MHRVKWSMPEVAPIVTDYFRLSTDLTIILLF